LSLRHGRAAAHRGVGALTILSQLRQVQRLAVKVDLSGGKQTAVFGHEPVIFLQLLNHLRRKRVALALEVSEQYRRKHSLELLAERGLKQGAGGLTAVFGHGGQLGVKEVHLRTVKLI